MPKRIDFRFLIQLITKCSELGPCFFEKFFGFLLGLHNGIPIIHIHSGKWTTEILVDVMKSLGHVVDGTDVARLMPKRKPFYLVDILTQQLAEPFIVKPWIDSRFQLFVVGRRKAFSNITLYNPTIRIIPFFDGAVRKALSDTPLFILGFSTQKICPHLLFQHVNSIVLPLPGLSRKGIEWNGW